MEESSKFHGPPRCPLSVLHSQRGEDTYVRQREQCQCPMMLVDSEPNNECDHSLNWVTVGKAKHNKGGSQMGKYPPCQEE